MGDFNFKEKGGRREEPFCHWSVGVEDVLAASSVTDPRQWRDGSVPRHQEDVTINADRGSLARFLFFLYSFSNHRRPLSTTSCLKDEPAGFVEFFFVVIF